MPPKGKAKPKAKKSVAIPKTPAELEQVLGAFLSGHDEHIRKATEVFKVFLNNPASVPALFNRIHNKEGPEATRQLACVLVCKKIARFWAGLHHTKMLSSARSDADTCRQYIMDVLHSGDAPRILLHNLAYLTTIIARVDFKRNRWPELVQWLVGALSSPNVNHVEASLRILYTVLENHQASAALKPFYAQYYPLFCGWIQNAPDAIIRHRAVLALHALLGCLDETTQDQCLTSVLPALVPALSSCYQNQEYDAVRAILGIFRNAMDHPIFEQIVGKIMISIGPIICDEELDIPVRTRAASFITDYIATRPSRITEQTPVEVNGATQNVRFLDIILNICWTTMIAPDDGCFDSEEDNSQRIATGLLDQLFRFIPRNEVYPACLNKFVEFVSSSDEYTRKAAYVLVYTCAEQLPYLVLYGQTITFGGVTKPLCEIALLAATHQLQTESSELVKRAICLAYTFLCEEFGQYIEQRTLFVEPMNALLSQLEATPPSDEMRKPLLLALENFIECIGSKVIQILPKIMQQLAVQLHQPNLDQQGAAIDSILSIAVSVDKAFLTYFPSVLPFLQQIIAAQRTQELLPIKDKAYRALGACARAIGIENWTPEVKTYLFGLTQDCIIKSCDEHGEWDHATLSSCMAFLGNIMACMGEIVKPGDEELIVMLSKTYDACIYALQSLSGVEFRQKEDAPKLNLGDSDSEDEADNTTLPKEAQREAEEDEEDIWEDDNDVSWDDVSLEMKDTALATLILLMKALGPKNFYLIRPTPTLMEDNYAALIDLEEDEEAAAAQATMIPVTVHPMERLQHVVIGATEYLTDHHLSHALTVLTTSVLLTAELFDLAKQQQVGVRLPFPTEYAHLIKKPVLVLTQTIHTEDDTSVVATAISQLKDLVKTLGASILYPEITEVFYKLVLRVLQADIPCLQVDEEYRDEESALGEEVHEVMFDLIGQVAIKLGPLFLTEFLNTPEILGLFMAFCGDKRPETFRGCAIGCLGEILEYTGAGAAQFVPTIWPLIEALLQDSSTTVRHNSLFLAGEAIQLMPAEMIASFDPAALQRVFNLVGKNILPKAQYDDVNATEEDRALSDNAVSTALRFVVTHPTLFPYQALNVILSPLPLVADDQEIVKILLKIPALLQSAFDVVRPFIPAIIVQLGMVFIKKWYDLRPGAYETFVLLVKSLFQQCPAEAQQAIAQLQAKGDAETQQALEAVLKQ